MIRTQHAGEPRMGRPSPIPSPGQTALFKGVAMIAIIVTMFLVPIVSLSEIKKQDDTDLVIQEIEQASDMPDALTEEVDPASSLIERLEQSPPVYRTGATPRVSDE